MAEALARDGAARAAERPRPPSGGAHARRSCLARARLPVPMKRKAFSMDVPISRCGKRCPTRVMGIKRIHCLTSSFYAKNINLLI